MKKILLVTAIFLTLATSCNRSKEIELVSYSLVDPACDACARTSLQYPLTSGKNRTERKINAALQNWVISAIDLAPEKASASVEEAVASFKAAHQQIRNDFPDDYNTAWETTVDGELCFQNEQLLAFCMETYSYTGGAHGYGSSHYLLFDRSNGKLIAREELIKDEEGFTALAEMKFREHYATDKDGPLNEQGFMFEDDRFHLPDNIGYTAGGLKLIYNPYEIAPYSDGQITIEIPYDEVNVFLRYKVEPRL